MSQNSDTNPVGVVPGPSRPKTRSQKGNSGSSSVSSMSSSIPAETTSASKGVAITTEGIKRAAAKVEAAKARLEKLRANDGSNQFEIRVGEAELDAAEATLEAEKDKADFNKDPGEELLLRSRLASAAIAVAETKVQVAKAEAQVAKAEAQVAEAKAERSAADTELAKASTDDARKHARARWETADEFLRISRRTLAALQANLIAAQQDLKSAQGKHNQADNRLLEYHAQPARASIRPGSGEQGSAAGQGLVGDQPTIPASTLASSNTHIPSFVHTCWAAYRVTHRSPLSSLVPSEDEIEAVSLSAARLVSVATTPDLLSPCAESHNQQMCAKLFEELFKGNITTQARWNAHDAASYCSTYWNSTCDFAYSANRRNTDNIALLIVEMKTQLTGILKASRQAALYASGAAMTLLRAGIAAKNVLVPVVVCTGPEMRFGAVQVLEPSYPVFGFTSHTLDLSSEHGAKVAVAFLQKAVAQANRTKEMIEGCSIPNDHDNTNPGRQIELSREKYFLKVLTPDLLKRGFGKYQLGIWTKPGAISHYFSLMNKLWNDDKARACVCFPLGYRHGNSEEGSGKICDDALIFDNLADPNLRGGPFRCGLPPKDTTNTQDPWQDWKNFMIMYRVALDAIHDAGVVHGDPYPSNLMWRKRQDGTIEIKIIDWDIAQFKGEKWPSPIFEDFKEYSRRTGSIINQVASPDHDEWYYKVLNSFDYRNHNERAEGLSSNDRARINEAFTMIALEQNKK